MHSVRIYCSGCERDDTEAVINQINKVCDEFGIKYGLAHLAKIAVRLIKRKKTSSLRWEEKEVTKQVALRILSLMVELHYCESCRERTVQKNEKEALRKKFRIIIGKKE
jgi:hypothetical protein